MATLTANSIYTPHTKLFNKSPFIPTTTITLLSLCSPKPTFSLLPLTTTTTTTRCSGAHQKRPEYTPQRIPDPNYVRILDTTLRDGEQSPGAAMTANQKLEIARHLARLGVDVIEAGFPAASKADLEAVKAIAMEVGNNHVDEEEGWVNNVPVICGLCRCSKEDIDAAWEAVKHAKKPRIHTFIATSEIHMQYKLNKSKEDVVEVAKSMVSYARSLGCHDVEFSPEDAGRYYF